MREVLYRDLYRGVVTWNKTKKRNLWGQAQPKDRPADDWISVPAPELRPVTDAVWQAAHARLDESRDCYLRVTKGRLWGRPLDGVVRKVLTRQVPSGPAADAARAEMTAQLADVRRELANLIEGLARTGASPTLMAAIRQQEDRQRQLEAALAGLEQRGEMAKA